MKRTPIGTHPHFGNARSGIFLGSTRAGYASQAALVQTLILPLLRSEQSPLAVLMTASMGGICLGELGAKQEYLC
jgi:hypothetical protein